MRFCVITAGESLPDFSVLSAALGSAFVLDRDTAAIRARHCWGILAADLSFYLDIVLKPDKLRLRLNPANFDFSCLKEEKTYSSQINFRLLCTQLSAFAPGALKNTGLRTMLANKPLGALMYDTLEDLEKETRRLTALANRS